MQSLQLDGIVKAFGETIALRNATFEVMTGQVVAICGENGAGKSTLMSIIAGSRQPTLGQIRINGQPVRIDSPHQAFDLGIRTVYQELSLLPQLSVTENLLLGDLPMTRARAVDWTRAHAVARTEMQEIGLSDVDVRRPVADLPLARQQMVEIAKAIRIRPEVLILDEPSGVLTAVESALLFRKIRALTTQGTIVLYISHRLEEVLEIADYFVVLKDGTTVDTFARAEADKDRLIRSMVGRPLSDIFPPRGAAEDKVMLSVEGLTDRGRYQDISFDIRAGEILGFCGLVGAGRSEIARAVAGADSPDAGAVRVDGQLVALGSPKQAIAAGIGFVTEERKHDGLVLGADIRENGALVAMGRVSRGPLLNRAAQGRMVMQKAAELDVRPLDLRQILRQMSGGNQQKVVLAKWLLLSGLRVLILDEPTRGVDIATKVQIYRLIVDLAEKGVAILLISSETPEVIGLAHRIKVLREGRFVAEYSGDAATEHEIFVASADFSEKAA